jgi:hypothetical protein
LFISVYYRKVGAELSFDNARVMAEIVTLVTSIDPLAPYKFSDDLMLELVNVTAAVENDLEGGEVGTCWVEIIEPHNLAKHQPRGGYMLDNRQVQMTCAKSAGVSLGLRITFRVLPNGPESVSSNR